MGRKRLIFVGLLFIMLLSACGAYQASNKTPPQALVSNKLNIDQLPTATVNITIPRQVAVSPTPTRPSSTMTEASSATTTTTTTPSPTVTPTSATPTPTQSSGPISVPGSGIGAAPYGQAPTITSEEMQLTQQLFALINSDRAARGLYPFVWNATLAGGARLHSWNMFHCGFSHTCPDGLDQCVRIANEGFAGYTDCGENIGEAGPYPTAWGGVYNVQEGMMNEGPNGWHFIHLTSTTLHRIGVGVYVEPNGWILFTEDMVS
ncbi:MAG TPA: hypothetical protein DHW02_17925 [Ktedonobacter sp.]|nr:hypothetical protein [Ktedonobacter sp.]